MVILFCLGRSGVTAISKRFLSLRRVRNQELAFAGKYSTINSLAVARNSRSKMFVSIVNWSALVVWASVSHFFVVVVRFFFVAVVRVLQRFRKGGPIFFRRGKNQKLEHSLVIMVAPAARFVGPMLLSSFVFYVH